MAVYKENLKYHFFLFLVTPVLGLVYGIKSKSKKTIRWSIFFFTVFYGSLFTITSLRGADGAVHWEKLYNHYQYLEFSDFWKELVAIIQFAPIGEHSDLYAHILSYLLGSVLNAPWLFFVVVAAVYGYFYSGALVKVLSYVDWNSKYNKFYFTFFLILLLLWKQPHDMQTVRTWTGMWVLIYAVISYHETKKKKYLILALLPAFIHIAYFAMAIPVWLVLFSGFRNPKVYFIIFIISTFFTNISEQAQILDFASTTEIGERKVDGYYLDDEKQELKEKSLSRNAKTSNFYKTFEQYSVHIQVLTAMVIFIFIFLKLAGFSKLENTLFSYGLAMGSLGNFSSSINGLYQRSWLIAGFFILSLLVIFLSKTNLNQVRLSFLKVKLPLFLFLIFMIPYMLFLLSATLSLTSPYLFLFPMASWIEPDAATDVRQVIGLFL